MLASLQDFVESLPVLLQWAGIILISAIPFVESYGGALIGVLAGLPLLVAVPAAIIGNVGSMLAVVYTASGVRSRVTKGEAPRRSAKREKLHRAFDKYGVAGVSLLGQTILPSQITSAALVSFGATRNRVVFWQIISIILWGTVFGVLAMLGIDVLGTTEA